MRDLKVCVVNGKPNIIIKTGNQVSPWLFDTGAAISVISEQLYRQLRPIPPLSPSPFTVRGANKKPLKILGQATLKIQAMEFSGNIHALVCSSLSQNAILGMDAIKQMKLALNPISQQFFHVNDVEVIQCGKLSGNVKLQPFEVRTVKIQTDMPDGNVLISPTTELMEIWNIFIPDAVIKVREGKGHLVIKNCLPTESVMS